MTSPESFLGASRERGRQVSRDRDALRGGFGGDARGGTSDGAHDGAPPGGAAACARGGGRSGARIGPLSARRNERSAWPRTSGWLALVALPCGLTACGVERSGLGPTAGIDLGAHDSSAPDSGPDDAEFTDLGPVDAEPPDAGSTDAEPPDAEPADLGPDAIALDAGEPPDGGEAGDAGRRCEPTHCPGRACRPSGECGYPRSCAELMTTGETRSGVYRLDLPDRSDTYSAFCELGADGGGWTLAAKVDGNASTWRFDAALWTNGELLNPEFSDESTTEAKLESFLSLSFSAIRVVFRAGSPVEERARVLPVAADSLRDLFAADAYVATSLGRESWLGAMPDARLQRNCNREGINVRPAPVDVTNRAAVRIGILGNNEDDCTSPNSFVGVGARYEGSGWPSAGSFEARLALGNESRPAFVRIYVR